MTASGPERTDRPMLMQGLRTSGDAVVSSERWSQAFKAREISPYDAWISLGKGARHSYRVMSLLLGLALACLLWPAAAMSVVYVAYHDVDRLRHVVLAASALITICLSLAYSVSFRAAVAACVIGSVAMMVSACVTHSLPPLIDGSFHAVACWLRCNEGGIIGAAAISSAVGSAGATDLGRDGTSGTASARGTVWWALLDVVLFLGVVAAVSLFIAYLLIRPLQKSAPQLPELIWVSGFVVLWSGSPYAVWLWRRAEAESDSIEPTTALASLKVVAGSAATLAALIALLSVKQPSAPASFVVGLIGGFSVGSVYAAIHASLAANAPHARLGRFVPLGVLFVWVTVSVAGALAPGTHQQQQGILATSLASLLSSYLVVARSARR